MFEASPDQNHFLAAQSNRVRGSSAARKMEQEKSIKLFPQTSEFLAILKVLASIF